MDYVRSPASCSILVQEEFCPWAEAAEADLQTFCFSSASVKILCFLKALIAFAR